MKTTRLNSSIIIGLIALVAVMDWVKPEGDILPDIIPESWVEGPFNPQVEDPGFLGDAMAGNLLYANNGTGLVTYWDEEEQRYLTYDQNNNQMLEQVVFNIDTDDADSPYAAYAANGGRTKATMVNGKVSIKVGGQVASFEQLQDMLVDKRIAKSYQH